MKQHINILSLILLLNSCVDQASSDIDFTLFNQTNKTVKILGFDSKNEVTGITFNEPVKAAPIIIMSNSNFKVTRITGIDNDTRFAFFSIGSVDSVRVVFNNSRVKVYGGINDNAPHNIFTGNENYQHFITEQDYESAEDCNDNCE